MLTVISVVSISQAGNLYFNPESRCITLMHYTVYGGLKYRGDISSSEMYACGGATGKIVVFQMFISWKSRGIGSSVDKGGVSGTHHPQDMKSRP